MTTLKRKQKLIKDGVKPHQCEKCLNSEWNGLPIPIELHHINGEPKDNTLSNLQLLCCNCHAQTENYKSKNRSTAKHYPNITDDELSSILNNSYSISEVLRELNAIRSMFLRNKCKKLIQDGMAVLLIKERKTPKRIPRQKRELKFCIDCNCELSKKSSNSVRRCRNCHYTKIENISRPTLEILINDIKNMGYVQTGRKYNVSDNGIRKWVKYFGLNPNEIKFQNKDQRNLDIIT